MSDGHARPSRAATRLIRIHADVREEIARRSLVGETPNDTVRRLLGLPATQRAHSRMKTSAQVVSDAVEWGERMLPLGLDEAIAATIEHYGFMEPEREAFIREMERNRV